MNPEACQRVVETLPEAFRMEDAQIDQKRAEADNVRLVQELYRALVGGQSLEPVLDPNLELEIFGQPSSPIAGRWRGRDEVLEAIGRNFALLEDQRPEILSVVAQGDLVVVVAREEGRYRPTGHDYAGYWTQIFKIVQGKIVQIREIADLGLAPTRAEV